MKKLIAMTLCLLVTASCGQSRSFELDSVYPGTFFTFRYPSKWVVTPADTQVTVDFEGNSIAIKFSPLEKAKGNDLATIQELVESYRNTVTPKGNIDLDETKKIGTMECVWIESSRDALRSANFFMPVDGGIYTGTAENIGDADIFETTKAIFETFEPKSVPVVKNQDPKEDTITHNGVIYLISFPKTWKISGDNPMLIKGTTKSLEINVKPDNSISPSNPAGAKVGNSKDCIIGNCSAFIEWSNDKTQATYYIPMHGKMMIIKANGFVNGSDSELDACINSFKYFEDKDILAEDKSEKNEPKTADSSQKPVKQVDIPKPQNVELTKGDIVEKEAFNIVIPQGWTLEEKPASVFDFYPADKESGSFEIIVQSYTKTAKEVALEMADVFAPGAKIETVDIAGTKAAQFTYKLEGYSETVTTIVTKGKYLYQLIYNRGKADLRNEYAAFLKSFEPK